MTRTTARLGGLAALIAGTLVLTGCADDASDATAPGSMTSSADAAPDAAATFNDADVAFVQSMIQHHPQAILMAELAETRFDRLFLQQGIEHHTGAVEMAATESAEGRHPEVLAMAASIRDGQSAEIAEMQQILSELGG